MDNSDPGLGSRENRDHHSGGGGPSTSFSRLFSPTFANPSVLTSGNEGSSDGKKISPMTQSRQSPYSPFAFGSPLTFSRRSVLNPASPNASAAAPQGEAAENVHTNVISRPRARGRDLYGGASLKSCSIGGFYFSTFAGRVMFGGTNNSGLAGVNVRRHNRLLASTPYQSSLNSRKKHNQQSQSAPNNPVSTSISPAVDEASSISSTAKTILQTLEKMSTPVKDALKIPIPRAEKRRALAEELLDRTLGAFSRRRPRLGQSSASATSSPTKGSGFLNGPPLRTQVRHTTRDTIPRYNSNGISSRFLVPWAQRNLLLTNDRFLQLRQKPSHVVNHPISPQSQVHTTIVQLSQPFSELECPLPLLHQ